MIIDTFEILKYAREYEGFMDLINLYVKEDDTEERDLIIKDIEELILTIRSLT